jgi:multicomponent Na+:H+ antiporter subunit E
VAKKRLFLAGLGRLVLYLLLWWSLTEGDPSGWLFALPVTLAAAVASLALLPPPAWRLRWAETPRFLGFFLVQMLLGGVDVARRVLDPELPIAPGLLRHRVELPQESARLLLSSTVNLLPGTVSVGWRGAELELHVLDTRLPTAETIAGLEERIGRMFG